MAKRGRPKKEIVLKDKGTPESQIRRSIIVKGGNPDKASDPLDAMEERGIINNHLSRAGHQYSSLYYRIFGKPFPSVNYDKLLTKKEGYSPIDNPPGKKEAESEWILSKCFSILRSLNGKTKKIIDNVVLQKIFPSFLFESKTNPKDKKLKLTIKNGLKALDNLLNTAKKSYKRLKK